jgi:hypothetical protein
MKISIRSFSITLFFLVYVIVGVSTYSDYGLSWDEPISRQNGGVNIKYIGERFAPFLLTENIKNYPNLNDWHDKDYGVAFEAPLVALEQLFDLKDERDVFLFRHLMTFLFFSLGVLAVFGIATMRFGDYRAGLLAAALIILSPRFFAESFYNSKDIVFMAAFAIAMYTMLKFFAKPNYRQSIIHGFVTAFAIDVRIMGVIILIGTLAVFAIKFLKNEISIPQGFKVVLLYLVATCLFVIAMFPWLWNDPIGNFILAFNNMAEFRWDNDILYMGEFIRSTNLPWHYIPVWILITTPPIYIGLLLMGCVVSLKQLVSRRYVLWSNDAEMIDLIILGLFIIPIVTVITLDSVLYDGWRQLYFIYPALILIAVRGLKYVYACLSDYKIQRVMFTFLISLGLAYNTYWIWSAHPLQNVYFNSFVGGDWRNKFELDYWGLGNRDALQYILDHDHSQIINIAADSGTPLDRALMILKPEDRIRFNLSRDNAAPRYVLTNYRWVRNRDDSKYSTGYNLFYQKIVSGEIILSVYKRKGA